LKVLKQRVRNLVQPEMGLGHSDVHGKEGRAVVGGNGDVTSAVKADGWTG